MKTSEGKRHGDKTRLSATIMQTTQREGKLQNTRPSVKGREGIHDKTERNNWQKKFYVARSDQVTASEGHVTITAAQAQ